MNRITEIYADGSLGSGSTGGLGWVLVTPDGPLMGFGHVKLGAAMATSNYVELEALKAALQAALSTGLIMEHAALYTDSTAAIDLIKVEQDGYGRGRPAQNQYRTICKWIAREIRINNLHLRHVKGHAGDPGNEAADRLAVMARRNREYKLDRNHGHGMASVIAADFRAALTPAGPPNHWASPAAIALHRANGEPLCTKCVHELNALEREAS